MFFDYPPNNDILADVVNKSSPSRIHFMKYDVDEVQRFTYIKTICGMIKYVCNKQMNN